MPKTIAIEDNLSGLQEKLHQAGYEVVEAKSGHFNNVDAVVVSGVNTNFMNMQDISTPAPVINADGKTLDEVLNTVKERCPLH